MEIPKEIFIMIKDSFIGFVMKNNIQSTEFNNEINSFITKDFKKWLNSTESLFLESLKNEYKLLVKNLFSLQISTYKSFGIQPLLSIEDELLSEVSIELRDQLKDKIKWNSIYHAIIDAGIILADKIYEGIDKAIQRLFKNIDDKINKRTTKTLEGILKNLTLDNKSLKEKYEKEENPDNIKNAKKQIEKKVNNMFLEENKKIQQKLIDVNKEKKNAEVKKVEDKKKEIIKNKVSSNINETMAKKSINGGNGKNSAQNKIQDVKNKNINEMKKPNQQVKENNNNGQAKSSGMSLKDRIAFFSQNKKQAKKYINYLMN